MLSLTILDTFRKSRNVDVSKGQRALHILAAKIKHIKMMTIAKWSTIISIIHRGIRLKVMIVNVFMLMSNSTTVPGVRISVGLSLLPAAEGVPSSVHPRGTFAVNYRLYSSEIPERSSVQ